MSIRKWLVTLLGAVVLCGVGVIPAQGEIRFFEEEQAYNDATKNHVLFAYEDFSGWALGTLLDSQIPNSTFSGTAALQVADYLHGPAWPEERFPDGRGILNGDSPGYFIIDFASPAAAFGLVHYDDMIGANVTVTLKLLDGSTWLSPPWTPAGEMEWPPGGGNPDGRFWGVVDTDGNLITQATISHNSPSGDTWGFDSFRGSFSAVPGPSALVLWSGLGAMGLVAAWRRRKRGG